MVRLNLQPIKNSSGQSIFQKVVIFAPEIRQRSDSFLCVKCSLFFCFLCADDSKRISKVNER